MTTATVTHEEEAQVTKEQVQVVRPLVDIYENSGEFLLHVEMPGVEKDHVHIELENNVLSLSGVRHNQTQQGRTRFKEFSAVEYRNSFSLPETIEITEVKAKLEAGVLILTLPKMESLKSRVITVQ